MPLAPEVTAAFRAFTLPLDEDLYAALSAAARLEDVGKGREGAVLTEVDPERGVPIERTTPRYARPAQVFSPVHARLARRVEEATSLPTRFNHCLFERYTDAYATMGAHSDQALDLAEGSFIAIVSAYQHPALAPTRRLMVASKEHDGAEVEIPLTHHGVVVFSTEDNRLFRHRIVLAAPARAPENPWLGVTFRTSKTFALYREGRALLADGLPLALADEAQRREFFQLRRRENREVDFVYPPLAYTLSESDLAPPDALG